MLELGYFGEEMALNVVQGATFGPFLFTMTNPDTTPVDLTGCAIYGSIRSGANKLLTPLTGEITDPSAGAYQLSIEDTVTVTFPAGETPDKSESTHRWDLVLVDSTGRKIPLYYGPVYVRRAGPQPTE